MNCYVNCCREVQQQNILSVFVWSTANDAGKTISINLSFLRWFGLMNDVYVHRYTH